MSRNHSRSPFVAFASRFVTRGKTIVPGQFDWQRREFERLVRVFSAVIRATSRLVRLVKKFGGVRQSNFFTHQLNWWGSRKSFCDPSPLAYETRPPAARVGRGTTPRPGERGDSGANRPLAARVGRGVTGRLAARGGRGVTNSTDQKVQFRGIAWLFFVVDSARMILRRFAVCAACLLLLAGCAQEMDDQRRLESQEQTDLFANSSASQPIPDHTITASPTASKSISAGPTEPHPRWLEAADVNDAGGYLTGKSAGRLVDAVPDQVLTRYDYATLLQRGRERFNISCAPCHDRTGSGNGMVARRGLKFPPSYHTEHLRSRPLGYFFNVATNGQGQMPAYGDYLSTDDRWAIVAYVRTLQFSQYAPVSELDESELKNIEATGGAR